MHINLSDEQGNYIVSRYIPKHSFDISFLYKDTYGFGWWKESGQPVYKVDFDTKLAELTGRPEMKIILLMSIGLFENKILY